MLPCPTLAFPPRLSSASRSSPSRRRTSATCWGCGCTRRAGERSRRPICRRRRFRSCWPPWKGLAGVNALILRLRPCRNFPTRSEEHTSELQSLMRISYAVFCLKKKKQSKKTPNYIYKKNKTKKNRYVRTKIRSNRSTTNNTTYKTTQYRIHKKERQNKAETQNTIHHITNKNEQYTNQTY